MEIYKNTISIKDAAARFFDISIPAGFPSPALDYIENRLDLNEHLIAHPNSTFIVRVTGESMVNAGIHNEDLLIVDRSLRPAFGQIVIAEIEGEFTIKKIEKIDGKLFLTGMNDKFKPLCINEETELIVWGVVLYSIHKVI